MEIEKETAERVRDVLLSIAKGVDTFAGFVGPGIAAGASRASVALIRLTARLLESRSTEATIELLEELAANPAKEADLGTLDEEVAAIIAERRRTASPPRSDR